MASYGYTFTSGDTVTPTKLNNARTVSNIVNADIKSDAAIAHTKLANIPSGQLLLGNGSNVPTATAVTGDVTISNTGVTAITADSIVNADINASAAIALSKLATGALPTGITVASANLVDGTIVNADIKSDAAIAGTKISPDFGSQNITTSGSANINRPSDHWLPTGVFVVGGVGRLGQLDTHGAFEVTLTSNGYRDDTAGTNLWKSYGANSQTGAAQIGLNPEGSIRFKTEGSKPTGAANGVTERMRITSSGNVGIGTTNPSSQLTVNGTASATIFRTGTLLSVANAGTEEGALMLSNSIQASRDQSICGSFRRTTSDGVVFQFYRDTTAVGAISVTTTATAYNTSSDYRLKENATPLIGGLSTIEQLQPCEFTWKSDGSIGRGFIAHELQTVVPEAVTGEKDAVDAEGNAEYQGVDASKLVPYLVSAVKELKARVEALESA